MNMTTKNVGGFSPRSNIFTTFKQPESKHFNWKKARVTGTHKHYVQHWQSRNGKKTTGTSHSTTAQETTKPNRATYGWTTASLGYCATSTLNYFPVTTQKETLIYDELTFSHTRTHTLSGGGCGFMVDTHSGWYTMVHYTHWLGWLSASGGALGL